MVGVSTQGSVCFVVEGKAVSVVQSLVLHRPLGKESLGLDTSEAYVDSRGPCLRGPWSQGQPVADV